MPRAAFLPTPRFYRLITPSRPGEYSSEFLHSNPQVLPSLHRRQQPALLRVHVLDDFLVVCFLIFSQNRILPYVLPLDDYKPPVTTSVTRILHQNIDGTCRICRAEQVNLPTPQPPPGSPFFLSSSLPTDAFPRIPGVIGSELTVRFLETVEGVVAPRCSSQPRVGDPTASQATSLLVVMTFLLAVVELCSRDTQAPPSLASSWTPTGRALLPCWRSFSYTVRTPVPRWRLAVWRKKRSAVQQLHNKKQKKIHPTHHVHKGNQNKHTDGTEENTHPHKQKLTPIAFSINRAIHHFRFQALLSHCKENHGTRNFKSQPPVPFLPQAPSFHDNALRLKLSCSFSLLLGLYLLCHPSANY